MNKITTKRSNNWTAEDKMLLKELVKERVHTIENKNTDTNTNARKVAAWADLLESFNSMRTGVMRTVAQLKSQWGSLKMLEKKKYAVERKERLMTGGGPPPREDPIDSNDIKVWLPEEFVTDTNEFDSDSIHQTPVVVCPSMTAATSRAASPVQEAPPSLERIEVEVRNPSPALSTVAAQEAPVPSALRKSNLATRKRKNLRPSDPGAADIAATEMRCRLELHKLQMENEERKKRVLELKEQLLLAKIDNLKQKK